MECAPNLDNVSQAIYTLYHDPDTSGKERASHFLDELQRSVYGWKVADDLLHHKTDLESCYFAAQTMKVKIQYSFHELPQESHSSLRDSLISHISRITSESSPVIVTQLCLALSHLALQMTSWKNPVEDLITKFSSNPHHIPSLLEVLTVYPEELTSRSLRLGANRRSEVIDTLRMVSPKVLQLGHTCVHSFGVNDSNILRRVFRCLGSWFSLNVLNTSEPILIALMQFGFQILSNPATDSMLHEAVADALCCAIVLIEEASQHQILAEILFQGVYSLVEPYHTAVAQEEDDKALNICRMFSDLCDSFLDQIVDCPNMGFGNLQNLDLLLLCVGHHDYEFAEVTFNFWYRLSESLYKRNSDSLTHIFEPYMQRLIMALCRHCQLEHDHDGIPEENGDFYQFRNRVCDLIRDTIFIIGSAKCFQQMFENLKNQGQSATWDVTEASLFVMAAVAKNIVPEEKIIVAQVVEAILSLPDTSHIAVRYTSASLIGELSEWINKHPHYLDPVLNFLLKCIQDSCLASVSATALNNICTMCRKKMSAHFSVLLNILRALDTFSLSHRAAECLLRGTALVLSELPFDQITNGMKEMCFTQLRPLSELLKQENASKPKEGSSTDPVIYLDRLSAIFRNVSPHVINGQVHPCLPVVEEVWPLLSEACTKYQIDVRIMERCCRCIRFIIRCTGKQSALLLEPLVKQIVGLYQQHQHSCFLYLGSILVDEYGSEPGCVQGLLDMLQAFCGPTFRLLEQPNGLRDNPATVDDLFRLCARFLQWAPVPFLQSDAVRPIIQCGILACSLDHKEANSTVMKFFQDFIKGANPKYKDEENNQQKQSLTRHLLGEFGKDLMRHLIHSAVFNLPTYMLVNLASVIFEMLLVDKETSGQWFEQCLTLLPTQGIAGSVTATEDQIKEFHDSVLRACSECINCPSSGINCAEHMKVVSASLREFARLYR